jgi:hypothetical protein
LARTIAGLFRALFDILAVLSAILIAIASLATAQESPPLGLLVAGAGLVLWILSLGFVAVILQISEDLRALVKATAAEPPSGDGLR